jgi:transcriptional regulator with XRE-family HTH domain
MEVNVEALKELRKQRVWTVVDLAEHAGVSKNTVSRAERGGSIYPTSIRKIARALGVEPQDLLKAS